MRRIVIGMLTYLVLVTGVFGVIAWTLAALLDILSGQSLRIIAEDVTFAALWLFVSIILIELSEVEPDEEVS